MSTKALIGVLLGGIVGITVYLFVNFNAGSSTVTIGTSKAQACNKTAGDCLPEVSYVDTNGTTYTAAQLAGKVVVVNFWATWCHPCQKEIPDLSHAYSKYKNKDVVFLGIMTDTPSNNDLLNFQSDFEMTYPVVRASSDIMVSYNYPQALPTTFVYNRGGKQVFSHVGPLGEAQLGSLLDQYVAEK
jgi:thiol-disulfide isomerase/thioredoxin